jgi:hypothetical protein
MTAGGGLLQLVATGKQDAFLTGNPQLTFFKMVYRRHTNFAIEPQAMYFDGTPNFGQRVSCLIPRRGDLLGRVYLDVTLPLIRDVNGSVLSYTNSIGHALIQEISLEIGEQEIDKQTGEWMEIWSQMTTSTNQRAALNRMIGRIDNYQPVNIVPGPMGLQVTIPLQFYFCNNPGLYLPLIALQYSPIRINITLRPLQQLFWIPPPSDSQANWMPACTVQVNCITPITNMLMWGDYVYLDVEERRSFVSQTHEYVIEQVQYTPPYSLTGNQNTATISVDFNHPIKEFLFVIQRDAMINRNEWFNYSSLAINEPANGLLLPPNVNYIGVANITGAPYVAPTGRTDLLDTAILQLDGYDRFSSRNALFFRVQQPYEHHTFTPVESYIYNYCFALRPEDIQPTGSMNASRIDSITWQIQMNAALTSPLLPSYQQRGNCRVVVYGHNYNIFRVINGFGGLLFTI